MLSSNCAGRDLLNTQERLRTTIYIHVLKVLIFHGGHSRMCAVDFS